MGISLKQKDRIITSSTPKKNTINLNYQTFIANQNKLKKNTNPDHSRCLQPTFRVDRSELGPKKPAVSVPLPDVAPAALGHDESKVLRNASGSPVAWPPPTVPRGVAHAIHVLGKFTYMNGGFLWDMYIHIYHTWMLWVWKQRVCLFFLLSQLIASIFWKESSGRSCVFF